MTAIGYTFIPNIAALYEVEDVRGYEAMTFKPLFETYPLWCVHQPVWYNRVDDPTRPFLSFLNVRYAFGPPGFATPRGWNLLYSSKEGRLFENPGALPRAFVPKTVRYEPNTAHMLSEMAASRDLLETAWVEEGHPRQVDNGSALLELRAAAQATIDLDVAQLALEPTPRLVRRLDEQGIPAIRDLTTELAAAVRRPAASAPSVEKYASSRRSAMRARDTAFPASVASARTSSDLPVPGGP